MQIASKLWIHHQGFFSERRQTYHSITENTSFHQSERFNSTCRFLLLHDPHHKYIILEGVCIPLWLSIESIKYIEVFRANILPLSNRFRYYFYKVTQFNSFIGYSLKEGSFSNTVLFPSTQKVSLLLGSLDVSMPFSSSSTLSLMNKVILSAWFL